MHLQNVFESPSLVEFQLRRACLQAERGLPYARVTLASGSGLQATFTGRVTLSPGSTLPALLTCFVMHDILCNGPKFEIMLKFSMENT